MAGGTGHSLSGAQVTGDLLNVDESGAAVGHVLTVTGTGPVQAAWQAAAGDFVERSGDTMTGTLEFKAPTNAIDVFLSAAHAQPSVRVYNNGLQFGPGGATAPGDVTIARAGGDEVTIIASNGTRLDRRAVLRESYFVNASGNFLGEPGAALEHIPGGNPRLRFGDGTNPTDTSIERTAAGELSVEQGVLKAGAPVRHVAAAYTMVPRDELVLVDTSLTAGGEAIKLPAAPRDGATYIVKDADGNASVNNFTVDPNGASIDGDPLPRTVNTNYGYLAMRFDGTDFYIIGAG